MAEELVELIKDLAKRGYSKKEIIEEIRFETSSYSKAHYLVNKVNKKMGVVMASR